MSTSADYHEGVGRGVEWAEQDVANHFPASEWIETFKEEIQTDSRRSRAFYLGALRGYRWVVRKKVDGRWGV